MIGVAVNLDNHIMRLMNDVNGKFDKARANKRMSEVKKCEVVRELKESTLNLAAADWKLKVGNPIFSSVENFGHFLLIGGTF